MKKNISQDEENRSHTPQGLFHNSTHLTLSAPIFNVACSVRHNNGGLWWPKLYIALISTLHFFLFDSTLSLTAYLRVFPIEEKLYWIFFYISNHCERSFGKYSCFKEERFWWRNLRYMQTSFKSLKVGYLGFKYI